MRFSFVLILFLLFSQPLLAQSNEGVAGALQASEILRDYAQFESGKISFSTGEYGAAIPEYYKVVSDHPKSLLVARASLMLGKSYLNLENYAQAVKNFRHLLKKYPEVKAAAEARFNFGIFRSE